MISTAAGLTIGRTVHSGAIVCAGDLNRHIRHSGEGGVNTEPILHILTAFINSKCLWNSRTKTHMLVPLRIIFTANVVIVNSYLRRTLNKLADGHTKMRKKGACHCHVVTFRPFDASQLCIQITCLGKGHII